jgi:hypothetical protein
MSCWADDPIDEPVGGPNSNTIDLSDLLLDLPEQEKVVEKPKTLDDLRSQLKKGKATTEAKKDDLRTLITPEAKKDDLRTLITHEVKKVDLRTLITPEVKRDDLRTLLVKKEAPATDDLRTLIQPQETNGDDFHAGHSDEVEHSAGDTIYSSVCTFESLDLSPELLKGVYAMGFTTPSSIQARALPLLLAKPPKNLIAQSQVRLVFF